MEADRARSEDGQEWVPAGLERRGLAPPRVEDAWGPVARPSRRNGRAPAGPEVDLNAATFEVLRGMGLSVTQASRFLRGRQRLGGFRSLEQIDELAGFPRDLKLLLRTHGRV